MTRLKFVPWFILSLALGPVGCGGPPQIGPDRESFKAVDALYTAVSLRDAGLVDRCAAEVRRLREAGRLPEAAARELESIVAETAKGGWEPALDRLARFMEGQRRRSSAA